MCLHIGLGTIEVEGGGRVMPRELHHAEEAALFSVNKQFRTIDHLGNLNRTLGSGEGRKAEKDTAASA